MNFEIVKIYSNHKLIVSESNDDNSDTLDAKFIICDFNPNKNGVMLNRETINEWLSTIEIKPLVGKVVTKLNGTSDFTGHNVRIVEKTDEEGNTYKDVEFDTSAFGSIYNSSIETIDGEEYIVASAKIWKRFSQAYDVIKRRMNSNDGIKTSWEIQVHESHFEMINGGKVKVIDKGTFIGHALLGENVTPAYNSSGLLQVASIDEVDNELAEALASDIQLNIELSGEVSKVNEKETSSLTVRDLYQKVSEVLNPKGWSSTPYYSVWEIYPEEHKILAYNIDRTSDDEYIVFTYSVNEDTVSIGEGVATKLSNILSEYAEFKKLTKEKEKLASDLVDKVEALVEASEKIERLQSTINELKPFKEKVEEIQRAEREQELAEKKEELKKIATKGGFITKEEMESSEEIKAMIESLDEKGIKSIIAERFIKALEDKDSSIETSETKTISVKTNIESDDDTYDYRKIMSAFLNK